MENLKSYFRKLEKTKRSSNYWLRFDARIENTSELVAPEQAIAILYPEITKGAVSFKVSTAEKAKKHMGECFSYPDKASSSSTDQAAHVLNLLNETAEQTECSYYSLAAEESDHPTAGIFWEFWYLLIPNNVNQVLGVSGSACD